MEPSEVVTILSNYGFPILACCALFISCKYMLDNQQKNTDRMFEMYDKANNENREAIKACTEAINKLCDNLERLEK